MGKKQQMLSPRYQVLICGTVVLLQLRQFWLTIQSKLADKGPYTTSIRGMRMRFPELQDDDKKAMKLRSEGLSEGWEDIKHVFHYQGFPYILKIIHLELMSRHHDNPLVGHFSIEKTRKLIARKYYWPRLRQNIKAYVKGCNVCLASKAVCHKPYGDFQSLPIPIHQ